MPPDSSPRGYMPPEARRQPEPRPRPVEQPVDVVEPKLAKRSGGLNMHMDDGSVVELYDFQRHVMDKYREPGMDDSALALRIIEAKKGQELAREIKNFSHLNAKVAYALIGIGQAVLVARNIERFDPAAHKTIAIDLVDSGFTSQVLANDKKFQHLDKDVFIASLSIKHTEDIDTIMDDVYIKRFNIDPNEAVKILFQHDLSIPNLNRVHGLNKESAKLIAQNKAEEILSNQECFELSSVELDEVVSNAILARPGMWMHKAKNIFAWEQRGARHFGIEKKPNTREDFPNTFNAIIKTAREGLDQKIEPIFDSVIPLKEGTIDPFSFEKKMELLSLLQTESPETLAQQPWAGEQTIEQLLKLQARSQNEEYDPWKTDLFPLVKSLEAIKLLDLSRPEQGQQLIEFVKRFGMSNLKKIARIFFELSGENGLSKESSVILEEFLKKKIEAGSKDKSILNELEREQRWLLKQLLADEIPKGIDTAIGLELLDLIKGTTAWKQGDKPVDLISTWKRTATEHPELAKLPEHYVEYKLEIPLVVRKKEVEGERTLEEKQEEVLALKSKEKNGKEVPTELGLYFNRLFNGFSSSLYFGTEHTAPAIIKKQYSDIRQTLFDEIYSDFDVEKKLERRKEYLIAKGVEGERLEKGLDAAQRSFIVQKAKAEKLREAMKTIGEPPTYDVNDKLYEQTFIAYMEAVARVLPPGKKSAELLIGLSVEHIQRMKKNEVWAARLDEIKELLSKNHTRKNITPDAFNAIASTFIDYISEHYLEPKQEKKHTGHTPFSPELLTALERAWQRTRNDPTEKNVLLRTRNKLAALEKGSVEETGKTKKISLVPAKGIMRIFSGDTGDACFTSQHEELADGEYPGLTAYSFVTSRGTANERVQGSVLFIETEGAGEYQGKKVLLVRANNPRENLLGQVDADKLIKETLNVAIDLAKARGIDMVVVPRDSATQSSSNRDAVSKLYKRDFIYAPKIELQNEPGTNFNSYQVWNPKGDHPVVAVWNRVDGSEVIYEDDPSDLDNDI